MFPFSKKVNTSITIVTNIPTPYRTPLFNSIGEKLRAKQVQLKVVFGAEKIGFRNWNTSSEDFKFQHSFLGAKNIGSQNSERTRFLYQGLIRIILREKPNVIIVPGFSVATLKLWILNMLIGTKYVIWAGAITLPKSPIKRILAKKYIKNAAGYLAYSSLAKQILESLGANNNIEIAINTVDIGYFISQQIEKIESPTKHLTYVGNLLPRKNVMAIIRALVLLKTKKINFVLDIVGTGSEQSRLENFVKKNKLNDQVNFHGHLQIKQISSIIYKSDCFLFQTDFDIWGLVLNEAMACEAPIIASKKAGSTLDLIKDGHNGFIIDFDDTALLASTIIKLLTDPFLAKKMGSNARKTVKSKATIDISANSFINVLNRI